MNSTRMSIRLSPELYRKLTALALANTNGNRTAMINQLINRAYIYPSELSLIPPHDAGITDADIDAALKSTE